VNKILITIQGRTLILFYQVKQGQTSRTNYIQVFPSTELERFNLKGLTPEMFCVNIADMVNIRGMYSGLVENEKQVTVAKWAINYEEFLQLKNVLASQLQHKDIVQLIANIPGYTRQSDDQYIDFEECIVPHKMGDQTCFSGFRLTLMTEEIEDTISTHAYYYLDTHTHEGWQDIPPPPEHVEAVLIALENKLQNIREAGVNISKVTDETDYMLEHDPSPV
jgi:hypothetical protein